VGGCVGGWVDVIVAVKRNIKEKANDSRNKGKPWVVRDLAILGAA
jgi:hypothetical protein